MSEFDTWPHAILDNRDTRLTVLLPDPLRGYYRGPRFEWAGMVALAEWKGHTFFGSWRGEPHRPRMNDDAAGTAGEFGMGPLTGNPAPLGWDEAPRGGSFLKIGVGRLIKSTDAVYSFGALYPIAQPAAWTLDQGPDYLAFTEDSSVVGDFAYRYTCVVTLLPGAPGFAVRRTLRNTGRRSIVQTHYCHNFLRIDDELIGPSYRVDVPFTPRVLEQAGDILRPTAGGLAVARAPGPEEGFFALLEGWAGRPGGYSLTVRTGRAGVGIGGSIPLCRLQVFGTGRTICAEPFVAVEVAPGGIADFTTTYTFHD